MGRQNIIQIIRRIKSRLTKNNSKITQLQIRLGYFFNNKQLLTQAITHKSIDPNPRKNYERLEFLGDAIIDHIISGKLIFEFPHGDEGLLTQRRSALVQKSFLAAMGYDLHLIDFIEARPSVDLNQEKVSQNQLANMFEAVIGAMFLDGGINPCDEFINKHLWYHRKVAWKNTNYKGLLIEYCHSNHFDNPKFVVMNTIGPEHEKIFEVSVHIGRKKYPAGFGENKKTAEQEAALLTLTALNP